MLHAISDGVTKYIYSSAVVKYKFEVLLLLLKYLRQILYFIHYIYLISYQLYISFTLTLTFDIYILDN